MAKDSKVKKQPGSDAEVPVDGGGRRVDPRATRIPAVDAESAPALAASEERYALAVRGSNDGFWDWDIASGEVNFSSRFKQLLGFLDHEMPDRFEEFSSRLHPDDTEATMAAIQAHVDEGVAYDVEYRLRHRDGDYRWFRARGLAVRDGEGHATRMAGSITDMTDRKQAEADLAKALRSLESLKLAFDQHSLVAVTDATGKITSVNDRFCEVSKYSRDELIGRDHRIVNSGYHPKEFIRDLWDTIRSGKVWKGEIKNRAKDGSSYWVETTIVPYLDPDGNPYQYIAIRTDITQRKLAEEKIGVISDRLILATRAGSIGIWDFDVLENTLVWDEQMYRLYGITEEAFSGAYAAWEAGLHPEDLLRERENLQRALRGEADFDTEFRVVWPDKSVHHIKANAIVQRDPSGQAVRMIGTNWDITERREVEEELRLAKQNAEAAARAKSEFLANMSHEIRTPMNGIIGMTELLGDTELSPVQLEYLMIVKHSADSLLLIINDILDFSKIEAGKLTLDHHPFHLRDSVGDTLQAISVRAAQEKIELAYQIEPDVPDHLIGDAGRLQQVLNNLVGNAIKFTADGEVVVNVSIESIVADGVSLHFEVRDTGIGIPPEKLGLIFESFTQAESSTTRRYGGTGLGLAISNQLVALMKGRLWVESELGSGSTFHFTTLLGLAELPGEAAGAKIDSLRGLRALVIDDHATNRSILAQMLSGWGMCPTLVSSGEKALALISGEVGSHRFDLILSDYMMPGMDGLLTSIMIRNRLGPGTPPIILLTSAGAQPEIDEQLARGILARRLTKPVKASDLLDAITQLFSSASLHPPRQTPHMADKPESVPRMRVLLAEDGRVNQLVATNLLESRGHEVTLAENGLEAVELAQRESFDAVLMDVQMPEMNGYEATAAIREWEGEDGDHLTIIAMTANAMRGDRDACLEAGMDDYVAKPVRAAELFAVLEKYAPARPCSADGAEKGGTIDVVAARSTVFDETEFRAIAGSPELIPVIIETYFEESRLLLDRISEALESSDQESLQRDAHSLKGLLGNFAAEESSACAARLDQLARAGQLEGAADALAALRVAMGRLEPQLRRLLATL